MSFGLLKSLVVYYGIPFRLRRMKRLYGRFLRKGSLAFDIGSHLGNRVRAFRSLGARAVSVEPAPECLAVLNRLYGQRNDVFIEPVALSLAAGTATLHLSRRAPALNTISGEWIHRVKRASIFDNITWERGISVTVVTLDSLIEKYGVPDFTKIDVEGSEPSVLGGLSQPLPALSFELLPASRESARACVTRLEELGSYLYNYSPVETMRFLWNEWRGSSEVLDLIDSLPREGRSGDIYAVRRDQPPAHNTP